MSKFFKKITGQKPFVYGVLYLGIIPLFAIIFSTLPLDSFDFGEHEADRTTYIYFSVVTVTTLGYGDITPLGAWGEMLTALESILGIALIGLFLNSLSHQHSLEVQINEKELQKKNNKNNAIQRFIAFNKLIEIQIQRYLTYTIPITVPIQERHNISEVPDNFKFNDMQDLFQPTLRLTDTHSTPAVEFYFKSLIELTTSLEELVKLGYAQHWKDLEDLCLEFITISKSLDFSHYILNQPNLMLGDQKSSDFDIEMIKKHKGEVKFLPSNSINAYVALYLLINSGQEFIKKYREITSTITNS